MIGTTEILIISGVVVLLFGATAIPKFAKSMGKARREFQQGMKEAKEAGEVDKTEDQTSDQD